MFAPRYFAPTYFAPAYFPPDLLTVPVRIVVAPPAEVPRKRDEARDLRDIEDILTLIKAAIRGR